MTTQQRYEMNKKPTTPIAPENPADRITLLKEAPEIMAKAIKMGWARMPVEKVDPTHWSKVRE